MISEAMREIEAWRAADGLAGPISTNKVWTTEDEEHRRQRIPEQKGGTTEATTNMYVKPPAIHSMRVTRCRGSNKQRASQLPYGPRLLPDQPGASLSRIEPQRGERERKNERKGSAKSEPIQKHHQHAPQGHSNTPIIKSRLLTQASNQ